MGSTFMEIFDVKVLYAIYPMVHISREYGNLFIFYFIFKLVSLIKIGIIFLLGKAFMYWKEEKYLNACIKCGELIWQKGLLRKGPSLCHGFVFFLLFFYIIVWKFNLCLSE